MKRPAGWTLAWLAWLGFVLLDFVAAVKERGGGGVLTLSRHIWAWFPWGWRRSVLAAFLAALGAHLVFEVPAWWLLTAVPVVAVIADGVWWAGEMSLIDKAARALALRWSKGKVDAARKGGNQMVKLLDGNKRTIVTLGFIVSGTVALVTGYDVSQWLDLVLRTFGWTDPVIIDGAKELATQIVPLIFALWAAASGLVKMWKQHQAGATPTEIGSPIGVVKAALADGTLAVASAAPATLIMAPSASTLLAGDGVALVVKPAAS